VYGVAVAMATAVQDLDTATRYLTETERTPPPLNVSNTWHTLHSLLYFSLFGCKEADKTSRGHVAPHLCEHCGVQFSVVLCSCCIICLCCCREGNEGVNEPSLGDMYYI
jgi:hypothetical protein